METLAVLPKDHPRRAEVEDIFRRLAAGLQRTQDPATGRWFQVVDKGGQPGNWTDNSGSAMFTYAIARGIELGLLDKNQYAPVVEKGYQGIIANATINSKGLVDIASACDGLGVQSSYDRYIHYRQIAQRQGSRRRFSLGHRHRRETAVGTIEKEVASQLVERSQGVSPRKVTQFILLPMNGQFPQLAVPTGALPVQPASTPPNTRTSSATISPGDFPPRKVKASAGGSKTSNWFASSDGARKWPFLALSRSSSTGRGAVK